MAGMKIYQNGASCHCDKGDKSFLSESRGSMKVKLAMDLSSNIELLMGSHDYFFISYIYDYEMI